MKKELLLGNEAIAWGAVLAGVNVVTGYPGTPSSEIVATLANLAADYGSSGRSMKRWRWRWPLALLTLEPGRL
jgi:TPP-dependent indolepyruvate ferredoxin oxidoreductase alpha subunit